MANRYVVTDVGPEQGGPEQVEEENPCGISGDLYPDAMNHFSYHNAHDYPANPPRDEELMQVIKKTD